MKKGDIGNEMYVSIKGRLGIYLEDFDLPSAAVMERLNSMLETTASLSIYQTSQSV